MTSTDSEIQVADPRLRRALSIVLLLLAAAALWSLYWLRARMLNLEYVALSSPSAAAEGVLALSFRFFAGLAVVLALVGSWYTVVAWKTLRGERFPPEGLSVARDTRIYHGRGARLRGFIGLFLAVLMLLLALALPTFGPRVFYDLLLPAFESAQ